jgi:hypothetical protein
MYGAFLVNSLIYQTRRVYSSGWESYDLVPGSNWVNFSGESDFTESWCWGPQVGAPNWGYSFIYTGWGELQTCETTHRYVVQQNRNGAWGTVTAYEMNPNAETIGNPSLGLDPNYGVLLWSEDNSMRKVTVNHSTGTWSTPVSIGSARYPSASVGDGMSYLTYASTQNSPPIFPVNPTALSLPKTEGWVEQGKDYSRVLFGVDTSSGQSFSIHMTEPTIAGASVNFVTVNDSSPGVTAENLMGFLATEEFEPKSQADTLEFNFSVTSHDMMERSVPIKMSINGMLVNAPIGTVLSVDHNLDQPYKAVKVKAVVQNLKDRRISLKPVSLSLSALGPHWVFGVAHVYSQGPGGTKTAKIQTEQVMTLAVPVEYSMTTYPNPFNPTARLNFSLPEDAIVSVIVYDILGREVVVLANGPYQIGNHMVAWNASNIASGVYFARFTVRNEYGTVKFSRVNKLLLMK